MKRLLLISFHYSPMTVSASGRAVGMAKSLCEAGWQVDVLTHPWIKPGKIWEIDQVDEKLETITERLRVIRVPVRTQTRQPSNGIFRKARILMKWASGELDSLELVSDSHSAMSEWINRNLSPKAYELIIGVYSPHAHLKLCYEAHRRFGIPYHIDFRDLWDNLVLDPQYSPSPLLRLKSLFIHYYWKKWLGAANSISSVSEPLTAFLAKRFEKRGFTLYTGFNQDRLSEYQAVSSDYFELSFTGSLYNYQHYKLLAQGLKLFLESHPNEPIRVGFYGIVKELEPNLPGSYQGGAAAEIQAIIRDERLICTPRIPQSEIFEIQQRASVLLMPTFFGVPGIMSGKIWEYLACEARILAIPEDRGAIAELLDKTEAGRWVNTAEDLSSTLGSWYSEWKIKGKLEALSALEQRMAFSQRALALKFSEFLSEDS